MSNLSSYEVGDTFQSIVRIGLIKQAVFVSFVFEVVKITEKNLFVRGVRVSKVEDGLFRYDGQDLIVNKHNGEVWNPLGVFGSFFPVVIEPTDDISQGALDRLAYNDELLCKIKRIRWGDMDNEILEQVLAVVEA